MVDLPSLTLILYPLLDFPKMNTAQVGKNHELLQLVMKGLAQNTTKPSDMSVLTKGTWISIAGSYDPPVGIVYDVGEIKEVIEMKKDKSGKATECVVKVHLPFYENNKGGSFEYGLNLADWRGSDTLPKKADVWRLCKSKADEED